MAAHSAWRGIAGGLDTLNRGLGYVAGLLVVVSALILTWEVLARYLFNAPSDWALELCILMLIASTFLAAGHTLTAKAHVNIDIVDHLMSGTANRWRMLLADLGATGLCGFVAANAWRLTALAWNEGWVSNSTWGAKLWIPFGLIALGMSLLTLQYLVQIIDQRLTPILKGGRNGRA